MRIIILLILFYSFSASAMNFTLSESELCQKFRIVFDENNKKINKVIGSDDDKSTSLSVVKLLFSSHTILSGYNAMLMIQQMNLIIMAHNNCALPTEPFVLLDKDIKN